MALMKLGSLHVEQIGNMLQSYRLKRDHNISSVLASEKIPPEKIPPLLSVLIGHLYHPL